MKTLLTNLTLQEATEAIKGTDNTIYRADWVAAGFDPADVAVAFNEDGELYDVINDEVAPVSMNDIMAHDWCVLANEEADYEKFDEGMRMILDGLRLMEKTKVDETRHFVWTHLTALLSSYYGVETLERFLETGKLVHNSKCECGDCRRERIKKNPKAELEKALGQLADLVGGTDKDGDAAPRTKSQMSAEDLLSYLLGSE